MGTILRLPVNTLSASLKQTAVPSPGQVWFVIKKRHWSWCCEIVISLKVIHTSEVWLLCPVGLIIYKRCFIIVAAMKLQSSGFPNQASRSTRIVGKDFWNKYKFCHCSCCLNFVSCMYISTMWIERQACLSSFLAGHATYMWMGHYWRPRLRRTREMRAVSQLRKGYGNWRKLATLSRYVSTSSDLATVEPVHLPWAFPCLGFFLCSFHVNIISKLFFPSWS
jgi:hypothetical protein